MLMPLKDPIARQEYNRRTMRARYSAHLPKQLAYLKKRKAELMAWVRAHRVKCNRCDEDHPACLEFHHRDKAQKSFDVTKGAERGFSRERIAAEISKCEVLCANCHRKEEWPHLARTA